MRHHAAGKRLPLLTSTLLGAVIGLAFGCTSPAPVETVTHEPFELSWSTFDAWRDHLASDDEAWREIPWRASYREGLRAASESGTPVLLWVMNGHPLGPT